MNEKHDSTADARLERMASLRGERPCTCHPDDNPPKPCAKQYALGECGLHALIAQEATNGETDMSNTSSSSSGGIGFIGLLTIVFIVLKLIGKIDWSWWWVLSPVWITTAFVLAVIAVTLAVAIFLPKRKGT